MRILGINFGHSASAALLEDGKVLSAVEEEKLSRIKGDATFPRKSIDFILKKHALSPEQIDIVAVGCQNLLEFGYGYRQLNRYFGRRGWADKFTGLFFDGLKRLFPYRVNLSRPVEHLFYSSLHKLGFPKHKVRLVNHHEAHAASAYYTSPWENAWIVTNDGKGDGLCGAIYFGEKGNIRCLDAIKDCDSIGQFYQSVTGFLGYRPNRHEGKITGLAAFGDPAQTFPLMKAVYHCDQGRPKNMFYEDESFRKDPLRYFEKNTSLRGAERDSCLKYIKCLHGGLVHFAVVYQLYAEYLKKKLSAFEPKELAAGIQKLAEDTLVGYVRRHWDPQKSPVICLAGGVFANVKINQRIREIPGVQDVYVHPAMDDAGTSLGAALSVWMNTAPRKQWRSLDTVYLGPGYTEQEMEESLKKYKLCYRRNDHFADELGQMIYEGKIIGRFDGALEWGPRALGNRSILARPIDKTINDTLNQRLKRTEFMPFAPSMLDEEAPEFLVNYSPEHLAAKYMTITYNVRPQRIEQIQAAVHIDGTARPQVVFEKDNPNFYRIIKAYKRHSGFGVVINTSFNMHEEPIVNSPDDAIRAFLVGAVDVLSLGPFISEQKAQ